jgi:hypothetical protein
VIGCAAGADRVIDRELTPANLDPARIGQDQDHRVQAQAIATDVDADRVVLRIVADRAQIAKIEAAVRMDLRIEDQGQAIAMDVVADRGVHRIVADRAWIAKIEAAVHMDRPTTTEKLAINAAIMAPITADRVDTTHIVDLTGAATMDHRKVALVGITAEAIMAGTMVITAEVTTIAVIMDTTTGVAATTMAKKAATRGVDMTTAKANVATKRRKRPPKPRSISHKLSGLPDAYRIQLQFWYLVRRVRHC